MAESKKRRRHASKWSLVIGLVILVVVAMSCRNNGDSAPDGAVSIGDRRINVLL